MIYYYTNYSFIDQHDHDIEKYDEYFGDGFTCYIKQLNPPKYDHLNLIDKYIYWNFKKYKYNRIDLLLYEFEPIKLYPIHLLLIAINMDNIPIVHHLLEKYLQIKSNTLLDKLDKRSQQILAHDRHIQDFEINTLPRLNELINYTLLEYVINLYQNSPTSVIFYLITQNKINNSSFRLINYSRFYTQLILCYPITVYECMYQNYGLPEPDLLQEVLVIAIQNNKWDYIFKFVEHGANIWDANLFNDTNIKLFKKSKYIKYFIKNTMCDNTGKYWNAVSCFIKNGYDDYAFLVYKKYDVPVRIFIGNLLYYSRLRSFKRVLDKMDITTIQEQDWINYLLIVCNSPNQQNHISLMKIIVKHLNIDILINEPCYITMDRKTYSDIYGIFSRVCFNYDNSLYDENIIKKPILNMIATCKQGYRILQLFDESITRSIILNTRDRNYRVRKISMDSNILECVIRWGDFYTFKYLVNKINIKYSDYCKCIVNNSIKLAILNSDVRILNFILYYKINLTRKLGLSNYIEIISMNGGYTPIKIINKKINVLKKSDYFIYTTPGKIDTKNILNHLLWGSYLYSNIDIVKFILKYNLCIYYENDDSVLELHHILELFSVLEIYKLYNSNLIQLPIFELIVHLIKIFETFSHDKLDDFVRVFTSSPDLYSYLYKLGTSDRVHISNILITEINLMYDLTLNFYDFQLISNLIDLNENIDLILLSDKFDKYLSLIHFNFYKLSNTNICNLFPFYNALYKIRRLINIRLTIRKNKHIQSSIIILNELTYSAPNKILKMGGVNYKKLVLTNSKLFNNRLEYSNDLYD